MHLLSRLAASKIRSNKFHENPRPSLAKNFPISLFLREITRPPFTFYSARIHALSTFFISRFIRFQFFILLYLSSIFSTLKRNSAFFNRVISIRSGRNLPFNRSSPIRNSIKICNMFADFKLKFVLIY